MSRRHHFEGMLETYLKMIARRPLKAGDKAIPEVKSAFREGFKCALIVLDIIEHSTTELNEDQMDIFNSRLEELTGVVPPPPDDE